MRDIQAESIAMRKAPSYACRSRSVSFLAIAGLQRAGEGGREGGSGGIYRLQSM